MMGTSMVQGKVVKDGKDSGCQAGRWLEQEMERSVIALRAQNGTLWVIRAYKRLPNSISSVWMRSLCSRPHTDIPHTQGQMVGRRQGVTKRNLSSVLGHLRKIYRYRLQIKQSSTSSNMSMQ